MRRPGYLPVARLLGALQGTSRDGDPQDHVHNQVGRITRTVRDGKWRALDTASLRAVPGALQGLAATAVECELTPGFGVAWVPRADGRGTLFPFSQATLAHAARILSIYGIDVDARPSRPHDHAGRHASSAGLGISVRA